MKKIITTVILAAVVVSCNQSGGSMGTVNKLENDDQKAGYYYGLTIGEQVKNYSASLGQDSLSYSDLEKGIVDFLKANEKTRESYITGQQIGKNISDFLEMQNLKGVVDEKFSVQGIMDVVKEKDLLFAKDSIETFMRKYIEDNMKRVQEESLKAGNEFLEEKKKDSKVTATPSGLLYEVITEGTGETPTPNSIVVVNYKGQTKDGEQFDASQEGQPARLPLQNLIRGWQEGLQLMKVGSKYKFYIPADLGYGEFGDPRGGKIGPNEVLIFDVELVSIEEMPEESQQMQPQISQEQLEELQRQIQAQQGN